MPSTTTTNTLVAKIIKKINNLRKQHNALAKEMNIPLPYIEKPGGILVPSANYYRRAHLRNPDAKVMVVAKQEPEAETYYCDDNGSIYDGSIDEDDNEESEKSVNSQEASVVIEEDLSEVESVEHGLKDSDLEDLFGDFDELRLEDDE